MKPDPSPSPGGKRPSKKKSPPAKESRTAPEEADLWDLDAPSSAPAPDAAESPSADAPHPDTPDGEPSGETSAPAQIPVEPRGPRRNAMPFKRFPAKPRKSTESDAPDAPEPEAPEEKKEPEEPKRPTKSPSSERRPVVDAFDDLEAPLSPQSDPGEPPPPPAESAPSPEPAPPPQNDDAPSSAPVSPDVDESDGKTPPIAPPGETAPPKGLAKVEKIGLIAFLVLFLAGGVFFVANSISKLPEEVKPLTPRDFPIKGARFEASRFKSYWRDPVATDTVRRGTLVIPVVEIEVKGGPAALRVFFRNSDGATIGDAVTRPVNGETTLVVPATAGFEEPGQHAAYRAGDLKAWSVEVHEGPSIDAPGREFKKLFEIPVSSNLR